MPRHFKYSALFVLGKCITHHNRHVTVYVANECRQERRPVKTPKDSQNVSQHTIIPLWYSVRYEWQKNTDNNTNIQYQWRI